MEKNEKNIIELYNAVKAENEQLVKENMILNEELAFYKQDGNEAFANYKIFTDLTLELRKARNDYKELIRKTTLVKKEYEQKLKNIINSL